MYADQCFLSFPVYMNHLGTSAAALAAASVLPQSYERQEGVPRQPAQTRPRHAVSVSGLATCSY